MRLNRLFDRCALFAVLASLANASLAQNPAANYPNKPLRLIIPYVAGGLGDTVGRLVAQHLTTSLGQPVLADNRPGASQAIALELAAKATPDGYTLILGTQSGLIFNTAARKSLPYDPLRDIASISMLFTVPYYLVVHPSLPARNVQELVALAKANPGKYSFGSIGVGSGNHLAMEILKARTTIDMVHVPFKGAPQAMLALVAGDLNLTFEGPVTSLPNIRGGKIRALASSGSTRTQALPDLPTMAESGLPGFESSAWFGLVAPKGTRPEILNKVYRSSLAILKNDEVVRRLAADGGMDPIANKPEEFRQQLRRDILRWSEVIRVANINTQ